MTMLDGFPLMRCPNCAMTPVASMNELMSIEVHCPFGCYAVRGAKGGELWNDLVTGVLLTWGIKRIGRKVKQDTEMRDDSPTTFSLMYEGDIDQFKASIVWEHGHDDHRGKDAAEAIIKLADDLRKQYQ